MKSHLTHPSTFQFFNTVLYRSSIKALVILIFPFLVLGQTGINVPEMSHCDTQMTNFLNTYGIPGATFALAKDGRMVYSRAFGNADLNSTINTQPYHMLRIASVSKPITAIGIMKMVDDGLLKLTDKVFGTGGILENHWYFSNLNITDIRYNDITVQMLLEHTAGWDSNTDCFPNPTSPYPWDFGGCDPIIAPLHVTQTLGETNPAKEEHLISFLLKQNLNFDPGTAYSYSNMGFLLLSEIIEEISGTSYEAWMQNQILHPLGIYDMYIGKNLLDDKMEREGEYVGEGYTTLSLYGDNSYVPWEYGGFSVEIMDGHGGWIATAKDLVRLLVAVDGFNTKPDILSSSSITTMSTPSSTNQNYAKGWAVNSLDNWWHSGAIDGTASYFVRTSGGYTWSIILNKRLTDASANSFWADLDALGWDCIAGTASFPSHDFLDSPITNASNMEATNVTNNSIDLSWQNGDGTSRIVVAKAISSNANAINFDAYPIDGTEYIANSNFGLGDDLGDGSFVVYNGSGSSVTISNLLEDTDYAIRVYEYKKTSNNGNNALYLLGHAEEIIQSTSSLSLTNNELKNNITIHPNVTDDYITIDITIDIKNSTTKMQYQLYNIYGSLIQNGSIEESQKKLHLQHLNTGVYMLNVSNNLGRAVFKIVKK